jgi:Ni/Fe-hydrogenase subunit HybB-like protein
VPKWLYIPFVVRRDRAGPSPSTRSRPSLFVGPARPGPSGTPRSSAPRFIATAFRLAGPALIIITLQIIRKSTNYQVSDKALALLRGIATVALSINMFLLISEIFTEFYTDSAHVASAKYLFFGLPGYSALVPWIWSAIALNTIALLILYVPRTRKSIAFTNVACVAMIVGIWIEKGMGLIIPAFVPSPLGEIVEYVPTLNEILVCLGIWAFGLLVYTILVRISIPVLSGHLTQDTLHETEVVGAPSNREQVERS